METKHVPTTNINHNDSFKPRSVNTLDAAIKNMEHHYDLCQEAKVKAEMALDEEPFGSR